MSLQACAELVQRADPDRFLAAMAAPPAARKVLFPLYALNVEVARAPWVTQEAMIAEMRLQWWRDALEDLAQGKPPRAHEVVAPLAEILGTGTDWAALDRLVAARRWDIYRDPFEDESHFDAYLNETAGALMWVSAQALGAPRVAESAVRAIGWASGLASFLRAVPELEARGRVPLLDGRPEGIIALAEQGLERLRQGRESLEIPSAAKPALRAGWMAGPILRQAATEPQRVADGALAMSEFARKGRLLVLSLAGRV